MDTINITAQEMDALIHRIDSALNDGLSLEPDDIRLVLQILRQFAFMQERLEGDETMKQRYLKLMGLVSASETQGQLFNTSAKRKKTTRNKRNTSKPKALPPKVCHHQLQGVGKGQLCPECNAGRLYKTEPASFIRITGQPPLSAHKHIMEQLRCNACGLLFTAPLPEEVLSDGARQQKYGYSARTVMAINKFYMGNPYYRQENLLAILGMSVSASTIYDQCALLADDLMPMIEHLIALAANAYHFHIDDTGHRIVNQQPIEKPNRQGKGSRVRSGVYSSALIATLTEGQNIVLFKTNIGHAGEWIDEILASRDQSLDKPIIMSDALSSNKPKDVPYVMSLCNAHSRRKYTDIVTNYPDEVEYVIKRYALIWQHDTQATLDKLTREQRQRYHQTHSLPVMQALKTWCETQQSKPEHEGNSGLGKAIAYYVKHYQGLTAFCRIPGAKIDNNLVEMTLKLIVRGRKNALFFKTLAGAEVGDVITSLIATCELNGVNLFDYLVCLQQHRWLVSQHPEQWTPWVYQETLQETLSTRERIAV